MSTRPARHQTILRFVPETLLALCRNTLILITVTAPVTSLHAAESAPALPAPAAYEAEYEARAMGMTTDAYRRLESTANNQFILSHGLSVSVLGANLITVEETSLFQWEDGVVPLSYHYKQTGVRRRDERVAFNWATSEGDQSTASMTREDREQSQDISKATLDNLSFSAQLSADLMNKPELRIADTVLSYEILDGRRLETHEYRVLGEEVLRTPAGELDTIKLERIRDIESERTTLLWLSKTHQYILAKLAQTEGGGSAMELSLKQIIWTGDPASLTQ